MKVVITVVFMNIKSIIKEWYEQLKKKIQRSETEKVMAAVRESELAWGQCGYVS